MAIDKARAAPTEQRPPPHDEHNFRRNVERAGESAGPERIVDLRDRRWLGLRDSPILGRSMLRLSALALLLACNPANEGERPLRPAPVGEVAPLEPHLAVAVLDATRPAGNTFWFTLKVPEGCVARVARDPDTDVPVARWAACPGVAGCQTLAPPASEAPRVGPLRLLHANTREGQQIAVYSGHGAHQRVQIGPLDDPPYVVVDVDASGGKCSLGQVAFGDSNAIVELIGVGPKSAVDRYFLDGPLRSSMIWYDATMRIAPGSLGDIIPGGYAAPGSSITLYDHRSRLIRGEPATGQFTVLLQDPRWSNIDWIAAAGETLLLGTATIPERTGFIPVNSSTPVPLLEVPRGGGTSPVVVDGDRLYWAEGRGRDENNNYDEIDLWTGPVPGEGRFTPRRIAGTDQRTMMQLHAGGERVAYLTYAADPMQSRALVVVDVANGGSRRVTTTPLGPIREIVGLSSDEVLLTVARPGEAPDPAVSTLEVVRLRIDSLGPVTKP